MLYDVDNRHVSTVLDKGTAAVTDDTLMTCARDATGRVVSRTTNFPEPATDSASG
jgi:hypothetical protein